RVPLRPVERGEGRGQLAETGVRHVMRGEAAIERVRRAHARARERQIKADPPGTKIEEAARADIGKEPDMDLRHGEDRALGGDAKAAIDRDAATAPHGDAVNERDIRLREAVDALDQPIFLAEEIGLVVAAASALAPRIEDGAHVAAGAKGAIAGAAHDN